jgi:hypothetical protein
MFWMKKNSLTLGILVSLVFLIHGCGGSGGGGGNNNPTGTASKSAAVSSKAIINALGTATTGTDPSGKPSLKANAASNSSDAAQVRQALKAFKASLSARKQKALQAVTDTGVLPCNGGGTLRAQSNDNNTPNDFTDDSFSAVYDNCTQNSGSQTPNDPSDDTSLFFDGSLILAPTQNGFAITFDNITFKTTDASGIIESVSDGTMSFSGTEVTCDGDIFFETGTFTMNFSGTSKMDLDKNGVFEIDGSFSMNNLTMSFAETVGPAPDCDSVAESFTLDGDMTATDRVNTENNFSATFDDFVMAFTPTSRNGIEGDTISMSGTITISSDCANGTFTISTPAGQEPFIPGEEDASCPVSGKFLVTGGGATTAVTFTSTGGVQIDEGNDGSIEQSFPDCESAEVCNT